ncbi:MlaD family protein [Williamsia deligens]|uniref:MlaD family protein n=1 Tax=Williamsia deligens TaxID=321325 RepID=A0ABW3G8Y9_9NOCA|nr:MlaD family protein [Williamsia deligens]MCP2192603.1 ABC-type transporter Mla maintaining outer membrane lipid asymmetry, component MlaD [Williamsia deligens]
MMYEDLSGRGPSRRTLLTLGAAAIVVLVVAAIPLTVYARGGFDSRVKVVAVADAVGDGLAAGGDVKFRGLIVGRVDSVTVTEGSKQQIALSIDADQADDIPDQVSAAYAPSNILGVTGIELRSDRTVGDTAGHLRDGERLRIGSESTTVSVATLLRQVGEISTTVTGTEVSTSIDVLSRVVTAVQPLLRSGADLLNLAAARQQMPLARFLQTLGPASRGVADLEGPFDSVLINLTRTTAEYTNPAVVSGVRDTLSGLVDTVGTIGGVVGDNLGSLSTLLDFVITVGSPLGQTLRSIPPAYDDTRELVRRLTKALPTQNGKVTLQVGATLANMPQLTSVLLPGAPLSGIPSAAGRGGR